MLQRSAKGGKPEGNHLFLKHKLSFPEPRVGLQKENSCSLRFVTMIGKDHDMQTKIDAVFRTVKESRDKERVCFTLVYGNDLLIG